jgi:hypothetical protein
MRKQNEAVDPMSGPEILPIDSNLDEISGGRIAEPTDAFVKISGPSWVNQIHHIMIQKGGSDGESAPKISLADLYQVVSAKALSATART